MRLIDLVGGSGFFWGDVPVWEREIYDVKMTMRRINILGLKPDEENKCLIEKDGLLVFSGRAVGKLFRTVGSHRNARLEKLS